MTSSSLARYIKRFLIGPDSMSKIPFSMSYGTSNAVTSSLGHFWFFFFFSLALVGDNKLDLIDLVKNLNDI